MRALFLLPLFPFRRRLLGPAYQKVLAAGVAFPCQVRTLSGIIRECKVERIDLLKVDVEGAEMDVLDGIEDGDWALVQQLCMEVEPANKGRLNALVDRLKSLGFTRVTVESMFGGTCDINNPVACTVFAVR